MNARIKIIKIWWGSTIWNLLSVWHCTYWPTGFSCFSDCLFCCVYISVPDLGPKKTLNFVRKDGYRKTALSGPFQHVKSSDILEKGSYGALIWRGCEEIASLRALFFHWFILYALQSQFNSEYLKTNVKYIFNQVLSYSIWCGPGAKVWVGF